MNTILLSITIFISTLSLIASGGSLYKLWRRDKAFNELHNYMVRMEKYAEGIANIHGGLKTTIMEHHSAQEEFITGIKNEILDQIGYTLRWSEVISKLIRVSDQSPEYNVSGTDASGSSDPLKKAEQMHEIGVEIVEIAFDEKTALEKKEALAAKEELAEVKEELAAGGFNGKKEP